MNKINKIISIFLSLFLFIGPVNAQTASLLPNAVQQFFDNNGNPLSSGTLKHYIPNTTTNKTTWSDVNETSPWPTTITLNSAGRPPGNLGIFGDGSYRQVVKDRNGNLIWDQVTASTGGGGGGGGTSIGDGDSVGTIKSWSGFVAPPNYAFAYGQAYSRITYSVLLAAITQTAVAVCTGGSPILSGMTDTSQLNVGAAIEAPCIPSGAKIISKTNTSVTSNLSALVTTPTTAIFFPYGDGDGLTTFNVPDLRGFVIAGRTNMGGVPSTRLTSTYFGSDPSGIGAQGGGEFHTPSLFDLPPHRHAVFIVDGGHTHTVSAQTVQIEPGEGAPVSVVRSGASDGTVQADLSLTGVLPADAPSGGTTNQTASTGFGNPYGIVQPTQILNYIIKILPDLNVSLSSCLNLSDAGTACQANTGTSGHTIPYLDTVNTWSGVQFFPAGIAVSTTPASLLGNPGALAGPSGNFTLNSLAAKATPDQNLDKLILYDATSGTLKSVTPGAIASGGTAGVSSLNGQSGALRLYQPPQGRLTLTSLTPVMTTSVASASTLYYTPYAGDLVPIYDGTNFIPVQFPEVSQTVFDTTKSPAAVAANSCYDIFAWLDGATPRATRGPAWTDLRTRSSGTILVRVRGIYLNNATITNGPAAARGTYVGTACTDAGSAYDYVFGGAGLGGNPGNFAVWNAYNRVDVGTTITDTSVSWSNGASANQWLRTDIAGGAGNFVKVVRGLDEDAVSASYNCIGAPGTGGSLGCGIGIGATNAPSGTTGFIISGSTTVTTTAQFTGTTGLGLNTVYAIEYNVSNNTATFYGVLGGFALSGLNFRTAL